MGLSHIFEWILLVYPQPHIALNNHLEDVTGTLLKFFAGQGVVTEGWPGNE